MAVIRGAPKTREYVESKPTFKEFTRPALRTELEFAGEKTKFKTVGRPAADKIKFWYRPGTSDDSVLHEILTTHWYRRQRLGFDVHPKEHWLDLGANIGGFALYCWLKHATATCYEPQADNFNLLEKNIGQMVGNFHCVESAVTHEKSNTVWFYRGRSPADYARYTTDKTIYETGTTVPNTYVRKLSGIWDGIKIDIEAAEHAILDAELLPKCKKLVLEYHIRKDPSMANFRSRMAYLKSLFNIVHYAPSLDKGYPGDKYPGAFDRMVFCLDPK